MSNTDARTNTNNSLKGHFLQVAILNEEMTELEKELELSKYLEEWVNNHYGGWSRFYYDVVQNQSYGLNQLKDSGHLRDLLDQIMGTLEGKFALPDEDSHLIPTQFASVSHIVGYLEWLKGVIDSYKPSIEKNITDGIVDNYIISGICEMVGQIDEVVDRCVKAYKDDSIPRPYQLLREKLFNKDVEGFVELVNSVLKGIPYLCRKKKFDEGHFQTMIQILLTILGFEPTVERTLSDGRIDMVVTLDKLIYIFEFKYTEGKKSQAKSALKQIKDKGYADPYKISANEIIGVGVSFSEQTKNINGFEQETFYTKG